MMQHDVIIVGGNVVGLSAACLFAQQGLSVGVIEKRALQSKPFLATQDYGLRVFALNHASMALFEKINAWAGVVQKRFTPYQHMSVWDANSAGTATWSASQVVQPHMGCIVEEQVLQAALYDRVQAEDEITIYDEVVCQARNAGQMTLTDGRKLSAALIVGADGASSWVRANAMIDVVRRPYQQTAVVATLKTAAPHNHTAYQIFDKQGPMALLPLSDAHTVSLVWSTAPTHAQELQQCSKEDFNRLVTLQSQHRLGRLSAISPRVVFPLVMQHAQTYVQPHVALVADAAHTIHPLAGQGMNLGLADVIALNDALLWASKRRLPIGACSVLKRYERARRAENVRMIALMKTLQWGFQTTLQPVKLLRQLGLTHISRIPRIERSIIRAALGLS